MNRVALVLQLSVVSVFLLVLPGCESPAPAIPPQPANAETLDIPKCAFYGPARISILPLTGFVSVADGQESSKINIYVSLLDSFGRQIKYPARFRFELYEHAQFVSGNKGERLAIWPDLEAVWPDLNLEDPQANDYYWRDYLRAYLFEFAFEPAGKTYILEVTCHSGFGKRLSEEFKVK